MGDPSDKNMSDTPFSFEIWPKTFTYKLIRDIIKENPRGCTLIFARKYLNISHGEHKTKWGEKVKGFSELAKLSVFSVDDVEAISGNVHTARSMLARLVDKGFVRKIRNNMYSVVNLSTDGVVASRYQIACAINDSAYLTHHTAFEFYGLANQVYYEVYVASEPSMWFL